MHLLYLDESGNENDPADSFFVLAGLSLFERQTFFLARELDRVQERHFPNRPPIAFHANGIRSGRGFWRKVPEATRSAVLNDLVSAIQQSPDRGRFAYAVAIEKNRDLWGEAAVERATEEVCRAFDAYLKHLFQANEDAQRGLLIFSEGRFDARAKTWVREFHQKGTSWGSINNLADIPYFASMKESRLLQAADLIAHAVWLLFERRNTSLISGLIRCFDQRDGALQSLVHVTSDDTCTCPACSSRRTPGDLGDWVQEATR